MKKATAISLVGMVLRRASLVFKATTAMAMVAVFLEKGFRKAAVRIKVPVPNKNDRVCTSLASTIGSDKPKVLKIARKKAEIP